MKVRAAVFLGIIAMAAAPAASAQKFNRLGANLIGYEEPPSISTVGTGQFDAVINSDETEIVYQLSYSLESAVQQAHIHFGRRDINGGITVFLCTNLGNGPVGTQLCPASPATISGTIRAEDVSPPIPATVAARAQGLDTGEFADLLRAIRAGATYVNVHSTRWPAGEIRDQIGSGHSH